MRPAIHHAATDLVRITPDSVSPMTDYIDIAEFRRVGYLQEANRLFFHPHGLALAVTAPAPADPEGKEHLCGVLDARDDPQGFVFSEIDDEMRQKAEQVAWWGERHRMARERLLGGTTVQQVGSQPPPVGRVPVHPEQAEAMCRLLIDSGDMTPMALMQLRKLWHNVGEP